MPGPTDPQNPRDVLTSFPLHKCDFPNCTGALMIQAMTDGMKGDVSEIKESLKPLPSILEHIATISSEGMAIRRDFEKALKEHDEIFTRLRSIEISLPKVVTVDQFDKLEAIVTSRAWVDTFKKICINVMATIGAVIIIGAAIYGLKMLILHAKDIPIQ